MAAGKKIVAAVLTAAIFIGMEVAAITLLYHNGEVQNYLISKSLQAFHAKVWGAGESIRYYFSLKGVNDELARENFILSQKLAAYGEEGRDALQDSLAGTFSQVGGFRYMGASIVKISRNKQHNYIILDKGAADGVQPHSGIISSRGVIGIVDAVSNRYSYAISFMNTEFSVSSRLGREGAVGPLVWDGKGSSGAVLRQIPLQYKFEKGDTVYTSGFSSIFPPDIPIGTVEDSRIENGATYEIKVRLLQDFSSIRYVTLVANSGREEIEELEKREGGK